MNIHLRPLFRVVILAFALAQAVTPARATGSRASGDIEAGDDCDKPAPRRPAIRGEDVAVNLAQLPDSADHRAARCGEDGATPIALLIQLHERTLSMDAIHPEWTCGRSGAAMPAKRSAEPDKRT